jgi:nitrous oxidase accessory protein NosD
MTNATRNFVVANVIAASLVVVLLEEETYDNRLVGNAFVGTLVSATDEGEGNHWDDGSRGNFWSDVPITDADGDGITDVSRMVAPNGRDRFPLVKAP